MFSYRFVRRITSMADLSKKRERDRLKVQRWPHYMKLAEGAYLGFRRGPDTWHARYRDRDGEQHYYALEGIESNDYDGAKRAAEAWFQQMGGSAVRSPKRLTVADALQTYLTDLERHGRTDAARTARGLFKLTVLKDPLAAVRSRLQAATTSKNGETGCVPVANRARSTATVTRSLPPCTVHTNLATSAIPRPGL